MNGHQVSIAPHQAGPDDLVIFHESCGKELQTVWRDCSVYVTDSGMQLIVFDYPHSEQPQLKTELFYETELRRYNMMHVTQWFYGTNDGKCGNGPFLRNSKATPMYCEYRAGHEGRCSYLDLPASPP